MLVPGAKSRACCVITLLSGSRTFAVSTWISDNERMESLLRFDANSSIASPTRKKIATAAASLNSPRRQAAITEIVMRTFSSISPLITFFVAVIKIGKAARIVDTARIILYTMSGTALIRINERTKSTADASRAYL